MLRKNAGEKMKEEYSFRLFVETEESDILAEDMNPIMKEALGRRLKTVPFQALGWSVTSHIPP